MSIVIRAPMALQPGCKLYYDCPLGGEDFKSRWFFEKHRGQYATFVGYSEELIGVLDINGRLPGRYIDPETIRAQFDGEEVQGLNTRHFIVADTSKASLTQGSANNQRLGDLSHPILFYPGDTVRFKKSPGAENVNDAPRTIRGIFLGKPFTLDDVPRYEVMETAAETEKREQKFHKENSKRPKNEFLFDLSAGDPRGWNMAADEIELVQRGNVWALYNDDLVTLSFRSSEEQAAFWAQDGIAHRVVGSDLDERGMFARTMSYSLGRSLEDAWRFFASGEADVIRVSELRARSDDPVGYIMLRLHDCFAQHREHVRALTERLWAHQVKQPAA